MAECNIGHISNSPSAFPVMVSKHRAQVFIRDLGWIPRSLLGGGKRTFAYGESACCLCGLYELCQE